MPRQTVKFHSGKVDENQKGNLSEKYTSQATELENMLIETSGNIRKRPSARLDREIDGTLIDVVNDPTRKDTDGNQVEVELIEREVTPEFLSTLTSFKSNQLSSDFDISTNESIVLNAKRLVEGVTQDYNYTLIKTEKEYKRSNELRVNKTARKFIRFGFDLETKTVSASSAISTAEIEPTFNLLSTDYDSSIVPAVIPEGSTKGITINIPRLSEICDFPTQKFGPNTSETVAIPIFDKTRGQSTKHTRQELEDQGVSIFNAAVFGGGSRSTVIQDAGADTTDETDESIFNNKIAVYGLYEKDKWYAVTFVASDQDFVETGANLDIIPINNAKIEDLESWLKTRRGLSLRTSDEFNITRWVEFRSPADENQRVGVVGFDRSLDLQVITADVEFFTAIPRVSDNIYRSNYLQFNKDLTQEFEKYLSDNNIARNDLSLEEQIFQEFLKAPLQNITPISASTIPLSISSADRETARENLFINETTASEKFNAMFQDSDSPIVKIAEYDVDGRIVYIRSVVNLEFFAKEIRTAIDSLESQNQIITDTPTTIEAGARIDAFTRFGASATIAWNYSKESQAYKYLQPLIEELSKLTQEQYFQRAGELMDAFNALNRENKVTEYRILDDSNSVFVSASDDSTDEHLYSNFSGDFETINLEADKDRIRFTVFDTEFSLKNGILQNEAQDIAGDADHLSTYDIDNLELGDLTDNLKFIRNGEVVDISSLPAQLRTKLKETQFTFNIRSSKGNIINVLPDVKLPIPGIDCSAAGTFLFTDNDGANWFCDEGLSYIKLGTTDSYVTNEEVNFGTDNGDNADVKNVAVDSGSGQTRTPYIYSNRNSSTSELLSVGAVGFKLVKQNGNDVSNTGIPIFDSIAANAQLQDKRPVNEIPASTTNLDDTDLTKPRLIDNTSKFVAHTQEDDSILVILDYNNRTWIRDVMSQLKLCGLMRNQFNASVEGGIAIQTKVPTFYEENQTLVAKDYTTLQTGVRTMNHNLFDDLTFEYRYKKQPENSIASFIQDGITEEIAGENGVRQIRGSNTVSGKSGLTFVIDSQNDFRPLINPQFLRDSTNSNEVVGLKSSAFQQNKELAKLDASDAAKNTERKIEIRKDIRNIDYRLLRTASESPTFQTKMIQIFGIDDGVRTLEEQKAEVNRYINSILRVARFDSGKVFDIETSVLVDGIRKNIAILTEQLTYVENRISLGRGEGFDDVFTLFRRYGVSTEKPSELINAIRNKIAWAEEKLRIAENYADAGTFNAAEIDDALINWYLYYSMVLDWNIRPIYFNPIPLRPKSADGFKLIGNTGVYFDKNFLTITPESESNIRNNIYKDYFRKNRLFLDLTATAQQRSDFYNSIIKFGIEESSSDPRTFEFSADEIITGVTASTVESSTDNIVVTTNKATYSIRRGPNGVQLKEESNIGSDIEPINEGANIYIAQDNVPYAVSYDRKYQSYYERKLTDTYTFGKSKIKQIMSFFETHNLILFLTEDGKIHAATMANSAEVIGISVLTFPFEVERLFKRSRNILEISTENRLVTLDFSERASGKDLDEDIVQTRITPMPIISVNAEDLGADSTIKITDIILGLSGVADFSVDIKGEGKKTETKNNRYVKRDNMIESPIQNRLFLKKGFKENGSSFPEITIRTENEFDFELSSLSIIYN